jgi:hypothetical protein
MRVNLTGGLFRLWTVVTVLWVSRWNSLRRWRLSHAPAFGTHSQDCTRIGPVLRRQNPRDGRDRAVRVE